MHPGPMNRGMEIAAEVADSARSVIVEQVTNGVTRADGRALPAARRQRTAIGTAERRQLDSPAAQSRTVVTDLVHQGVRIARRRADRHLLIDDGRIVEIGAELSAPIASSTPTGLIALPGLVDLHTHLREPGREDAETVETGTRAAALGGFTAVHAMANTDPVADTAGVVEQVWRLGREAGHCDVQPVGAVTVGLAGEQLAELGAMADSRGAGPGVLRRRQVRVTTPLLMRRALEYVKAFDGVDRPARAGARGSPRARR